jgi:hypothetical protein
MFKIESMLEHPWIMESAVYPMQEKSLRRLGWRKTKKGATTAAGMILKSKIAALKSAITTIKKVK